MEREIFSLFGYPEIEFSHKRKDKCLTFSCCLWIIQDNELVLQRLPKMIHQPYEFMDFNISDTFWFIVIFSFSDTQMLCIWPMGSSSSWLLRNFDTSLIIFYNFLVLWYNQIFRFLLSIVCFPTWNIHFLKIPVSFPRKCYLDAAIWTEGVLLVIGFTFLWIDQERSIVLIHHRFILIILNSILGLHGFMWLCILFFSYMANLSS